MRPKQVNSRKLLALALVALAAFLATSLKEWAEGLPDAPPMEHVVDDDGGPSLETPTATTSTTATGRGSWSFLGQLVIGSNGPLKEDNPEAYQGSLGQAVSVTTVIALATSTECLRSAGGGSTCGLYSYGSVTPISTSGHATVCMSQRRVGVTIGDQAAATEGQITVDGSAEPCAGWTFTAAAGAPSQPHDFIPKAPLLALKGAMTYTGRYCDKSTKGMGGGDVYPPCGLGYQTQLITTPGAPTNSASYNVVINSTNVEAATDGSATQAELRDALVTAINGSAQASAVTAANSGNNVLVTSDIGGQAFTFALGSQPAAPLVVGAAVTVAQADDAECVTMAGAGATCPAAGDSRHRKREVERTGAVYYHGRASSNATRFVAPTER